MSIKMMNKVWQDAALSGSELLMLLALADFSDDNGSNIFPSVKTLAQKTRLSVKQSRNIIHNLLERRIIILVKRGGWDGERNRSNEYRINLESDALQPKPEDGYSPSVSTVAGGSGGTPMGGRGTPADESTVLPPIAADPSYNHPIDISSASAEDPAPTGGQQEETSGLSLLPDSPASPEKSTMRSRPTTHQEMMVELSAILLGHRDYKLWADQHKQLLGRTAKILLAGGATVDMLQAWLKHWRENDWRGQKGQPPTYAQMLAGLGEWREKQREQNVEWIIVSGDDPEQDDPL